MLSNDTITNYFTIFLQTIIIINFYWFLSELIINVTFLFSIHYLPQQ